MGKPHFDQEIIQDLVRQHQELQEVWQGVREDRASLAARIIIKENCNHLKHELNRTDEAGFSIVVPGTEDFIEYTLTREAFQEMIAPFIQGTIACCHQMCQQAQVKIEQINHILLYGSLEEEPSSHGQDGETTRSFMGLCRERFRHEGARSTTKRGHVSAR